MSNFLSIKQHPYKGRCYFSTKSIAAGTVVLQSKPYASINDSESRKTNCARCLGFLDELNCQDKNIDDMKIKCEQSNCSNFVYCSKKCKNEDWRQFHAFECGSVLERELSSLSLYARDYMRLLARVFILRAQELNDGILDDRQESFDDVWTMCSNATSFPENRIDEFCSVAEILTEFLTVRVLPKYPKLAQETFLPDSFHSDVPPKIFNKDYIPSSSSTSSQRLFKNIVSLICKEECNSFGLYTFKRLGWQHERQSYGLSLFPKAVFFNHSCVPNVGHITRDNGEIFFYTLRDIHPGEELMITYVSLQSTVLPPPDAADKKKNSHSSLESKSATYVHDGNQVHVDGDGDRRDILKEWFFFDCRCERCVAEDKQDHDTLANINYSLKKYSCPKNECKGWAAPSHLMNPLAGMRKDSGKNLEIDNQKPETSLVCEACHDPVA